MLKPLSLYVALRYIRAKRRNRFVSFISFASVIGIALSVMVLITVLSVMNGFDQQIQHRIFTMVPHITVTGLDDSLAGWKSLRQKIDKNPFILGSAPVITQQGILTHDRLMHPVIMMGVDETLEKQVSDIHTKMTQGSLSNLKPGEFGMVIGEQLALILGVTQGDDVNVIIPQVSISPVGILPRFKRFKVVGIFHVGTGFGFDSSMAYIDLHDAQVLFNLNDRVSAIQAKVANLFSAPHLSDQLQKQLGFQYQVSNWTADYGAFYHAVQMEKTMMFFILLLLVAIAAFNLVSGLVMLVNDKQADIAILRTYGATPHLILRIFVLQGLILGLIGTSLGLISGIILSLNVTRLVNFIQQVFHVQLLTSGVYFVDYLPSQLQFSDVTHVCIAAVLMSLLATVYPAWRAARTHPAEALRYE